MPGEEALGLAMGAVALASLFSTCIEVFDYFELGRNYVYDYDLACKKLQLLQARLVAWGGALRVTEPGHEDAALRRHWDANREVIYRSLSALESIMTNSDLLMQKYELRRDRSAVRCFGLKKRTVWAIHDKAKFDGLIADVAFFIENLEKVTERLRVDTPLASGTVGMKSRGTLARPSDDDDSSRQRRGVPLLSLPAAPATETFHTQRDSAFPDGSSPYTKRQQTFIGGMDRRIWGTQYNHDWSIGVQGILGDVAGTCSIHAIQINTQNALGIQGVVAPEALALLQTNAFTRERS